MFNNKLQRLVNNSDKAHFAIDAIVLSKLILKEDAT